MPDNEELNSLERLQRRLYDPNVRTGFNTPDLVERPAEISRGWDKLKRKTPPPRPPGAVQPSHISGPARFFIVALAFFVVTGGAAAFYLLYGGRSVSANNIVVTVQGPTSISSGDTIPLLVTVENHNPVAVRATGITVDFPAGTMAPDEPGKMLPSYTDDLGDIPPGGKAERTVRATIFGSEEQHVSLPVKIEYHTDGSNGVFVKNKQYDFVISSSPISITVNTLSQASAGQTVTLDVVIRSNATSPLSNVAVVATYPFGFALTSATPQASGVNNTVFKFSSLAPGEEKHLTVKGVLSGENNDHRIFDFKAGTLTSADAVSLGTSYVDKQADILLTKPFLSTTLSVNQDTSTSPVITPGVSVPVVITWANTLPTTVTNAHVTVSLSGDGLDPTSISSGSGFYRSSDKTVLFDSTTNPGLATLVPGDTGQGSFTLAAKKAGDLANLSNPTIVLNVSVSGQRLSEANVPETITSTINRIIKIGTNLALSSKIVHSTGPFKNTGPWPPEPDKETTYTVVYSLSNSGNAVAGTKVTATLPVYVRYTGAASPSDGSVTYNDSTRTVTWTVGDVASGAESTKSVAFQIALTPSITQSKTSPTLISAQQVTAVDRFTQRPISGTVPALTTQTTQDPGYSIADGSVK